MPLKTVDEKIEYKSSFNELLNDNSIILNKNDINDKTKLPTSFSLHGTDFFLASGHSSRSIFNQLHNIGVDLSPKDFAIGLRLQISQKYINKIQYGEEKIKISNESELGPAEFTLKYFDKENNRNVYTFCMCPGGVIVNSSNGDNEVAVNGMSYSTRASRFANAAFVVNVGGSDFDNYSSTDNIPLKGMHFQQYWEKKCYEIGGEGYTVPAQRVCDYIEASKHLDNERYCNYIAIIFVT
jgi:uncharacterized FAD-dependent dehydrogenase